MAVILVGHEKGGVGKSMIATNLAAWAAQAGVECVLLDVDPQASSANWAGRRAENILKRDPPPTPVHCVQRTGKGLRETIVKLEEQNGLVIVDSGGRDSPELRDSAMVADLMYVPMLPAQSDVETVPRILTVIDLVKTVNEALITRALMSNVPTVSKRYYELEDSKAYLDEFGDRLPISDALITNRKAYRDAFAAGLGVVELNNELASDEIEGLVAEIERLLSIKLKTKGRSK